MNEIHLTMVGTIVSGISRKELADGTPRAGFRLVQNERRFDKATNRWTDGSSFFVQVTCWRRLAENVLASLSQGDPVVVTGRLYTHVYEVDGEQRSLSCLDAHAVGIDLGRCTARSVRSPRTPEGTAEADAACVAEPVTVGAADRVPALSAAPGGGG